MEACVVPYDCTIPSPHGQISQHFRPASSALAPSYVGAWQKLSAPGPALELDTAECQYALQPLPSMTCSGQTSVCFPLQTSHWLSEWECASPLQTPCQAPIFRGAPGKPPGRLQPRVKRSRNSSVKSEASSTLSDSLETATLTVRVQTTPIHQFSTPVDKVMRVINAKSALLAPSNEAELVQMDRKKEAARDTQQDGGKANQKRFRCDVPGCPKSFAGRANLNIHRRFHTGESPHVCPHCQQGFTQKVNLQTHINRHTGERPHKCPECPRRFPQRSNLRTHERTHLKKELRAVWICRFGNCSKSFTQKGNLKAHQNMDHVAEIEAFNSKLAGAKDKSMLSEEDKEMAKYLDDLYNLANKGIKGRGKGRKVMRVPITSPATSPINTAHAFSNWHIAQQQQPTQQGLSNPVAHSLSGPPMLFGPLSNTREPSSHGGYGMDSDRLSDANRVHGSTLVIHAYEDEHGQELAFGVRMIY